MANRPRGCRAAFSELLLELAAAGFRAESRKGRWVLFDREGRRVPGLALHGTGRSGGVLNLRRRLKRRGLLP